MAHQDAVVEKEEQEQKGRSVGDDDADSSMDWGARGGGLLPGGKWKNLDLTLTEIFAFQLISCHFRLLPTL